MTRAQRWPVYGTVFALALMIVIPRMIWAGLTFAGALGLTFAMMASAGLADLIMTQPGGPDD